ncbi:hypothetical protein Q5O24_06525 [Eubacteriaceae bacterium ES3]|nr:hypothetical protein Q5O24_06525 [Eubacteriaceae bacterium ES3]
MTKKLLPLMLILTLLFSACSNSNNSDTSETDPLADGTAYLQEEMDSLQLMLSDIGASIGDAAAGDEEIYASLNERLNSKAYFYDILVTDAQTNITQVATKVDTPYIGLNLKSVNQLNELFVDTPMLIIKQNSSSDSTPFLYASVPIENGGWVIAYIDPYSFGAEFSQFAIGQDLDLGILDTNGTNIYTNNMTEIGKNILTDHMYDSFVGMQTLVQKQIIPNAQGQGSYTYNATGTSEPVEKEIEWNTVNAFGQDLRVYANTEPGSETTVSELRSFNAEELAWFDEASDYIYDEFTTLETLTDTAVVAYQESGPDSDAFSTALAQVSQNSLIAKAVVFVDTDNMIITSYPSYYEGNSFDLYDLDIPSLTSDRQPFITEISFSDAQTSALQQLGFITPVVKDDEIAGYIVAQARLYDFAADLTSLKDIGQDVNLMLTDSNGTILFDGDIAEVGKNIYDDDLYSEGTLQDYLQNEFKVNSEGESSYEFYGAGMTEIIPKEVTWKTITFMWHDFKLSMNSEWKPAE